MSITDAKPTVLIVDDSQTDRQIISIVCRALGCDVEMASDGFEALSMYKEKNHDLVLTDYMMEPINGIYLVKRMTELNPDANCLIVTGFPNNAIRQFEEEGGIRDYITKPIQANRLKETLRLALNRSSGATQQATGIALTNVMDACPPLAGGGPAIQELRKQLTARIGSQQPLILTGPAQTGKRVIAKFMHENGPNAGKSLVELPCPEMGELRLRNEFITAKGDWGTQLNQAEGSTLVLNQILSLPMRVQRDFARQFDPISEKTRLIALSDEPLDAALEEGFIDETLYFKLTVEHIELQPDI